MHGMLLNRTKLMFPKQSMHWSTNSIVYQENGLYMQYCIYPPQINVNQTLEVTNYKKYCRLIMAKVKAQVLFKKRISI